MSNTYGNPRIAEYGRLTRFVVKGHNCPLAAQRRASRPWSVKRAVLRLMQAEFHLDELPLTEKRLRRVFCSQGRYLMGAQTLAIRLVLAALDGHLGAQGRIELMTDGPVPTEAEVTALYEDYD